MRIIERLSEVLTILTPRKQMQELEEARAFAMRIVETVREPLVILDDKLRVKSANHSFYQIFQVSKEDTENQLIYDLGNRQWDILKLRTLLEEILPQQTTFQDFEMEHTFPTIGRKTMLLNARRITRTTSLPELILLAIEDITERKRAEERLAQQARELARSNAELEQFAYVAAHDMQEPLRMVTSYCRLLAQRYHGKLDADADDFIHFAVDGATRMQSMIQALLDYARVGTRGGEFKLTACDAALEEATANLKELIEESGATVTRDPLPTVHGDRAQLVQLFQNLIGNAMKFRGDQPVRVHVGAHREEGGWKFFVRDNGIGIASRHSEQIFKIFQRLHERGKYPGTGIGLSICKRIVERHRGRIWVESQPGKGATFSFTLPI